MEVKLVAYTPNPEEVLAEAASRCYKKGPSIERVISCIRRGHTSVLEHVSFTFSISGVSRALSHQLVRHRIASYTQESQRYVRQEQFEFVVPDTVIDKGLGAVFSGFMREIQEKYDYLIRQGIPAEDARFVLPNACATSLVFTINLRSLINFWTLRMDKHAQWEIRKMAFETFDMVMKVLPNLAPAIKSEWWRELDHGQS